MVKLVPDSVFDYICKMGIMPFPKGPFNDLTLMKRILTITLCLLYLVASARTNDAVRHVCLDDIRDEVRNSHMEVKWINERYFTYTASEGDSKNYYIVDTRTWKPLKMFDNKVFADSLNKMSQGGADPLDLRLGFLKFERTDPLRFSFSYKRDNFQYDIKSGKLEKKVVPEVKRGRRSTGSWNKSFCADSSCYVKSLGHDIWLYRGEDSLRLSNDGERYFSYATGGKWDDLDEDKAGSVIGRWVGKTRKRIMVREDWRSVETLTIVNSLAEPRPTAKTYKFAMPGDTGVVKYNVMLADADSGKLYRIDGMDRFKDQLIKLPLLKHIPCTDRYAYLLRISRTCDTLDLCRIDVTDRSVKTLISEVCKPHYNEQLFSYHILNDGKDILWWSDRSGKGRWYLYDGEGNLRNALTAEDFVSGEIVRIDTLDRKIVFEGYGKEPGVNPHYRFFYEARFDGKSPARLLTPGNGHHSIRFSPGGKYIEDTWSRMDCAPQRRISDRKGREMIALPSADVSGMEAKGWRYPEVITLKAADGVTDLWGVVYTPLNLEPGRKYPIISSVYPGPQDDQVPQAYYFDENDNQTLAQRGFVVINFAYRGSGPYRGKDFHTYGYGNLRDYPLEDDYAVVRQIAEKYPYADSTRVGIYGHSGGGFMTVAAMLARPDFYKVGVAASGNHDNNIYRQQWAETFHGVDNTGSSFECKVPTNIENAGNLKGKLLLITGDVDDNVHPAGTYRLVNALIKKNKKFDMMVFPGRDHGMGGTYYVNLIHDYFTDHLK